MIDLTAEARKKAYINTDLQEAKPKSNERKELYEHKPVDANSTSWNPNSWIEPKLTTQSKPTETIKSKRKLYIGIGIGVLALTGLTIYLIKRKK